MPVSANLSSASGHRPLTDWDRYANKSLSRLPLIIASSPAGNLPFTTWCA